VKHAARDAPAHESADRIDVMNLHDGPS